MNKKNGNGNGKVEKHHFDNSEGLSIGNGISIAAAGEGDTPSEVHLYAKVPGTQFASRFSFKNHELLADFIEQLIAYRRLVFPDAPEINANATMDDFKE